MQTTERIDRTDRTSRSKIQPTVVSKDVLADTVPTTDTVWNGNTDQLKMRNETETPSRHYFNSTTHEDRSTGILPIQDRKMMMMTMMMMINEVRFSHLQRHRNSIRHIRCDKTRNIWRS